MENWKETPEWPGYEVSDQSQARSLDREVAGRWGVTQRKGKLLSQSKVGNNGDGTPRYWATTLFRGGRRRCAMIHVLMLEAFVGPRPEGAWALHRDDNPDNNTLENLYWGTPVQNTQDATLSGRHPNAAKAARTRCRNGHEFTPENTYIRPAGHRECRKCHVADNKRYRHKNAASPTVVESS